MLLIVWWHSSCCWVEMQFKFNCKWWQKKRIKNWNENDRFNLFCMFVMHLRWMLHVDRVWGLKFSPYVNKRKEKKTKQNNYKIPQQVEAVEAWQVLWKSPPRRCYRRLFLLDLHRFQSFHTSIKKKQLGYVNNWKQWRPGKYFLKGLLQAATV